MAGDTRRSAITAPSHRRHGDYGVDGDFRTVSPHGQPAVAATIVAVLAALTAVLGTAADAPGLAVVTGAAAVAVALADIRGEARWRMPVMAIEWRAAMAGSGPGGRFADLCCERVRLVPVEVRPGAGAVSGDPRGDGAFRDGQPVRWPPDRYHCILQRRGPGNRQSRGRHVWRGGGVRP